MQHTLRTGAHPCNIIYILMINDMELFKLNIKQGIPLSCNRKSSLPGPKRGEHFLQGPIPWPWLSRAGRLPGRTLHVAIAIWHIAFMNKNPTVAVSNKILQSLDVDRYAKSRSLELLEKADLISVQRRTGRNPVVTILGGNK